MQQRKGLRALAFACSAAIDQRATGLGAAAGKVRDVSGVALFPDARIQNREVSS